MRYEMKEQQDPSINSEHDSDQKEILKKLSILEDLLKKKDDIPLTFKEACTYLGYAPSYLYKLTYRKIIPHYKPTGKMIFFSKNELDEWIYSSAESAKKTADKLRMQNGELKAEKNFEKDPNQVDLFEKSEKVIGKKEEKVVWIEFPLKSRKKK
jgi:excisionase family DNA binding protein